MKRIYIIIGIFIVLTTMFLITGMGNRNQSSSPKHYNAEKTNPDEIESYTLPDFSELSIDNTVINSKLFEKISKDPKKYKAASINIIELLPINQYPTEKSEIYNLSKYTVDADNHFVQDLIRNEIKTWSFPEAPVNEHAPEEILSNRLVRALKSATELYRTTSTKKNDLQKLKEHELDGVLIGEGLSKNNELLEWFSNEN